jgi:U4/U6.U5 tri-snRNP component SNU23
MSNRVDDGAQVARRTWDVHEAERKYKERMDREKEDSKEVKSKKAGFSAKMPPPAFTDANSVQARPDGLINVEEWHGKRELAAPVLGRSRKGKSAGFYCEACDLTFKDQLSFLDHMNSSQRKLLHDIWHCLTLGIDYRKLGLTGKVEWATLEQVQARLEWLIARKRETEKESGQELDLSKRIADRRRMEEDEKKRKRERKKAKRLAARQRDLGASDIL